VWVPAALEYGSRRGWGGKKRGTVTPAKQISTFVDRMSRCVAIHIAGAPAAASHDGLPEPFAAIRDWPIIREPDDKRYRSKFDEVFALRSRDVVFHFSAAQCTTAQEILVSFPHPALKRIDCDGQVQPPSEITEAEEEESDEEAVVEEEETDEEYDDDDEEEEAEDPDNNEENDHDGEEEEDGEYGVEDNSAKEHLFERELEDLSDFSDLDGRVRAREPQTDSTIRLETFLHHPQRHFAPQSPADV
jgi:hypothetical protein